MLKEIDLQESFRAYLENEYRKRKETRSNYSLRSFAHFLDVNAGNLNQFFSKKRKFSITTIEKILLRLNADPRIRKEFLKNFNKEQIEELKKKNVISNRSYQKIENVQFEHISEPLFLILLNLIEIESYNKNKEKICRKMNISLTQLNKMLRILLQYNFIQIDSHTKEIKRTKNAFKTDDDIPLEAIKKHHKKVIEKSKNSLELCPVNERDITSVTLPINPDHLPKAKELIREFQDNLIVLLGEGKTSEVYHLNISLFPALLER